LPSEDKLFLEKKKGISQLLKIHFVYENCCLLLKNIQKVTMENKAATSSRFTDKKLPH